MSYQLLIIFFIFTHVDPSLLSNSTGRNVSLDMDRTQISVGKNGSAVRDLNAKTCMWSLRIRTLYL